MTRLMLMRHGQASFGAADYDQLSATGVLQASYLGLVMRERGEAVDGVWHGPMQRHRQTAQSWLEAYGGVHALREHAMFGEFDHREVIGCHEPRYRDHAVLMRELAGTASAPTAFADMFKAALARWQSGEHDGDYLEPWPAFQSRCTRAMMDFAGPDGAGGTHLIATSGGVIAAIAQHLLGLGNAATMQLNWNIANASITCIQHTRQDGWKLVSLNEHAHFRGDQRTLLSWR